MQFGLGLKVVASSTVVLFGLVLGSGKALGMNECLDHARSARLSKENIDKVKKELDVIKRVAKNNNKLAFESGVMSFGRLKFLKKAQAVEVRVLETSGRLETVQFNNNVNYLNSTDPSRDSSKDENDLKTIIDRQEEAEKDQKALHEQQEAGMMRLFGYVTPTLAEIAVMKAEWKAEALSEAAKKAGDSDAWREVVHAWEEAIDVARANGATDQAGTWSFLLEEAREQLAILLEQEEAKRIKQ
jgi:hypothetical protein